MMDWKPILGLLFFILVIALLGFYWMIPFDETDFGFKEKNYNFSLTESNDSGMQFYSRMRFPSPNISYRIEDCPLGKEDNMERAFEIISEKTILDFYAVLGDEEIFVTCDSGNKIERGLLIAGEGGPTNITKTSNFNVIKAGAITLIRESQCEDPNVGMHELLHVLGFDHSPNPNNIMYEVSKCNQEISLDIIDTINNLYSTPTYADLSIDNVSAVMHSRYIDAELKITNNGLKVSEESIVKIYANNKLIKEFEVEGLDIGYGRKITLKNIFVFHLSVDELRFVIEHSGAEIDNANNEI